MRTKKSVYNNPLKVVMYYLLIDGMTCFGHQNGFLYEFTSVYGYILNKTYEELWLMAIGLS